ncbi:MAG: PGF-CTERM sorting domain-containing protein [Methanimicrococcus sp.]|nr:PGF-CTERM sorting domain-containing protein [Methanimicrococcus sp.]
MNRIIKILFLSILAIALLTAPALGAITESEALKTAETYSKSGEKTAVYGPYKSENKSYYYAEYRTGGDIPPLTGVIVIDMGTGDVVSDEKTLRQVLFTVYRLMSVNNESIAVSNQTAQKYRSEALLYTSNPNIANIFNEMAETYDEIEAVEKDVVVNLNVSYENAMKLSLLFKDLEESLKSLSAYENDLAANAGITKQYIENAIEEIEINSQNFQAREDIGVNYSNERVGNEKADTESTPGFGLIAAVFALAAIGFFIQKQKK